MQSVKVLVVLLALSQVECAPPSIWPAHRFSPPAASIWPFKQSAPSSLFFSTNFPGSTSAPSEVALPAEEVVSEPVVDVVDPAFGEFIPKESVIPAEVIVTPEETVLPVEAIVPEIVEVQSAPQPQEPVAPTSENVVLVPEVTDAPVTDIPVEASTTTVAPPSFQDSDTFKAYEQFINTWLTTASITLNRPDLLNMVTNTRPKPITTGKLPAKQTVEKSTEKSVEKVVEQVTVSESFEPKKVSGPIKKVPAAVPVTTTESPVIIDIAVTSAKPVAITEPITPQDVVAPSEPQEATTVASDLAPESIKKIVTEPELIVIEPIPENSPVQEQVIAEVSETIAEKSLVKEQINTVVELLEAPSSPRPVSTPELIAVEPIAENLPIQEHTITEIDLVAEPSILQPVVSQPAVEEFVLAAEPQLSESSYSKLAVSADGTIMVAPPAPPALSNVSQSSPVQAAPAPLAPSNVAQPSPVQAAPVPVEPRVIETYTPEGLTYTLQLFPKQGSSFFYSHTLGG